MNKAVLIERLMVRQACILIRVYLKLARRSVRNPTLLYLSICIVLFLAIPFVMLWRAGALGIVIQMISLKVHSLLPETVHLTFAGIFWFWLFLPFFVKVRYASAEGYDRLSLYPLDFRRFYILNLAAGVTDLPVLVTLPILLALLIGLGLTAQFSTLCLGLIVSLFFVFVSLLIVQVVGFLLEMAFASHRWLRILYGGASIGLIALFLLPTTLILPIVLKYPAIFPEGLNLSSNLPVLPSTLAANALVHMHEGDIGYVFRVSLPFLGAYLIASGYLAYRLAVKIHLGGAQAGSRRIGLRKSSLFERTEKIVEKLCFFLPLEAKALLVKDLVYLMRWNALKVSYPVFVVMLFVFPWQSQDVPFFFFFWRMFLFMLYLVNSFSLNAFGMDGAAVHHCFIAPTSGRDIIVVKNCTQLVHTGALLIALAVSLLVGRGYKPTYSQYLSFMAFFIGGILILHMLGGMVSILHPMTIQVRKIWGRTSSGSFLHAFIAGLAGVAYGAADAGLCLGYFWKDQNMVLALACGVVGAVSILYIRSFSPMAKFLENHKEHLLMSLENGTRLFIHRSRS